MDRTYVRTSSLARKFFEDFPEADELPLLLPAQQQSAFDQHVLPLLKLDDTSTEGLSSAVKQLLPVFSGPGGFETYSTARAAADYVQSPLALCILDTAAAFSLLPGASALADSDPPAFHELLTEDLRRRLVANHLDNMTENSTVTVVLDEHPSVKAATPCPGDTDRLVLPNSALFRHCSSSSSSSDGVAYYMPFKHVTDAARQQLGIPTTSSSSSSRNSILKRAVWRRRLTRECSHYLAPILGKDASGTVLLVGSSVASIVKGYTPDSSSSSKRYQIAFAGYADSAAAQDALEGCVTEVLTRYFARHPQPVTDASGIPVYPLAVASAHHLLLLLPEPTETQLPTAIGIDHNALVAAAAAGAWNGPADAAAADPAAAAHPAAVAAAAAAAQGAAAPAVAAGQPPPPAAAAAGVHTQSAARQTYRDIELCFDLSMHPSIEAVLLSAPNQLAAFSYDGDSIHTLSSSVRALSSGALLLDPSAVARGASWCGDEPPVGEHPAAAAAPAGVSEDTECGAAKLLSSAVLSRQRMAAAVQQVAATAAAGWQPLLLLPMLLPNTTANSSSSSSSAIAATDNKWLRQLCTAATAAQLAEPDSSSSSGSSAESALLSAVGSLWQQLLIADVGSYLTATQSSNSADTAAAGGEKWWQQLSRKFAAQGFPTQQQQQQQQQGNAVASGRVGSSASAGIAADGEVSAVALLHQPQLLRSLLTAPSAAAAAVAAAEGSTHRAIQQLSRVHGWVWSSIDPHHHQQQQGCKKLPSHLCDVVRSRWWCGPVMRGSLLEGSITQE